jgi:hypothetical protein
MKDKKKNNEKPEAYPKPNETDKQLHNQPEYIDQEPNRFDKEITGQSTEKQELKKDKESTE